MAALVLIAPVGFGRVHLAEAIQLPGVRTNADGYPFNDKVDGGVVQRMRRRVAHIYLIARGRQRCTQVCGEAGVGTFAVVDDDLDFANVAAAGLV